MAKTDIGHAVGASCGVFSRINPGRSAGRAGAIAVTLNWQNDIAGYWINPVAVSAIDLGFVLFVLLPGHIRLRHGLPGPVLWILGVVFSTLGLFLESAG